MKLPSPHRGVNPWRPSFVHAAPGSRKSEGRAVRPEGPVDGSSTSRNRFVAYIDDQGPEAQPWRRRAAGVSPRQGFPVVVDHRQRRRRLFKAGRRLEHQRERRLQVGVLGRDRGDVAAMHVFQRIVHRTRVHPPCAVGLVTTSILRSKAPSRCSSASASSARACGSRRSRARHRPGSGQARLSREGGDIFGIRARRHEVPAGWPIASHPISDPGPPTCAGPRAPVARYTKSSARSRTWCPSRR